MTDPFQNIYITGYVSGTTDFDPGAGVYPISGSSDLSPFVLKLSRCTNITTATLDISACNSYTLNNATFDSSGFLIVNPKPAPELGPDKDLCSGTQLTVTPGLFTSYLWQDMSIQSTLNIDTAGLFWVTITDGFNCSATDSIRINAIIPNPNKFLK